MDHVLDLIPFDERVDPSLVGAIKVFGFPRADGQSGLARLLVLLSRARIRRADIHPLSKLALGSHVCCRNSQPGVSTYPSLPHGEMISNGTLGPSPGRSRTREFAWRHVYDVWNEKYGNARRDQGLVQESRQTLGASP